MAENELLAYGVAILGAVGYAVAGYATKVHQGDTEFKPKKAAKTVILGVLAGTYIAFTGMDMNAENVAIAMSIVGIPIIDKLLNEFFGSTQSESDDSGGGGEVIQHSSST